jgi:uncharacterized protein involved in outer membrane biogenesis
MTTTPFSTHSSQSSSPSPVLVIQQSEQVWIAKLLTWAGFAVEGNSREDALRKLDQQVKAQLADGEIAYLDLPLTATNPWLAIAGKYADDPNWDEHLAAIEADRRVTNAAESRSFMLSKIATPVSQ